MQNDDAYREGDAEEAPPPYFDVFDVASVGLLTHDEQGRILEANLTLARLLGSPRGSLAGRLLGDFVLFAHQESYARYRAQLVATGGPQVCELRLRGRDGGSFWARLEATATRSDQSGVLICAAVVSDITERKRAEEGLLQSEERLRSLFDGVPVGLYRTSPGGQIIDVNPALAHMLGYTDRESLLAVSAESVYVDVRERQRLRALMERDGVVRSFEEQLRRPDGSVIWVRDSVRAVRDADDRIVYYEGSLEDITERKQAEEMLRSLTLRDDLTGLYNRRGFVVLAEQQLRIAHRVKKRVYALFLDMDGLKHINDRLGHSTGDQAIQETAAVLQKTFRKSDIVARLGGDEFAVLTVDVRDDSSGAPLARLQANVSARNRKRNRRYELSFSVGTSYYDPENPCSVDDLLARADGAMYLQKRAKDRRPDGGGTGTTGTG